MIFCIGYFSDYHIDFIINILLCLFCEHLTLQHHILSCRRPLLFTAVQKMIPVTVWEKKSIF